MSSLHQHVFKKDSYVCTLTKTFLTVQEIDLDAKLKTHAV